jgi:succinate-semialdehyde dehydrogenase/glutarate-semialdehyde dehydrogenase
MAHHPGDRIMSKWLQLNDGLLFRQQCCIDDTWVDADDGRRVEVRNPATGEVIGSVPCMTGAETRRAVAAAGTALPAWRGKSGKERAQVLRRWFGLMMEHREDLARILTAEGGKPLAEARGEIAYGASFVEWFAEEARRIDGDVLGHPQADKRILVLRQPVGVCAAITPWNFPNAMITRKVAPAVAAGCTVVCKPASQTPYSALAIAELAQRAGIPAGVFNVVTGDAQAIGKELCENAVVRKLSFTGSTEVGRLLMAQCAPTVKRLSLELGGNAPFIVFDDADLDAAVEGCIASKFRHAGQTCVCANRIYVQAGVLEEFSRRLVQRLAQFRIGAGVDEGVDIGPLIDGRAVAKVEEHVADAVAKGARVLAGGRRHALGGNFFQPTLLAGVTQDMKIAREETFGPVAPLFAFDTVAEVLAMANATEYGLAGYFYSRDLARVFRVAEALEVGMVGVNVGIISTEVGPFGGIKQSGFGREGSKYGIDEYLDRKYVCIGGMG